MGNLAGTYQVLGRLESALQMKRDVYSGYLKLFGEEHEMTLGTANNYANSISLLQRFEEAKAFLSRVLPVARRALGTSHVTTLKMQLNYAAALCVNPDATLDDLREAVNTLEDAAPVARRVFGGAHPLTKGLEGELLLCRTSGAQRPRNAV